MYIELFVLTIVAFLIAVVVRTFIAQPFVVSGDSMLPSFKQNDYLVIDEVTYDFEKPKRGDIAVFRYPLDPSVYFIKRIVGIPGDAVVIHNGVVSLRVQGATTTNTLAEPYILPAMQKVDTSTTTLGEDEYFALGDNRNESFDSRVWGPVPERYIVGRALVRVFPITSFGTLPGEYHFQNVGTSTAKSK